MSRRHAWHRARGFVWLRNGLNDKERELATTEESDLDDSRGLRLREGIQGGGPPCREADEVSRVRDDANDRRDTSLQLEWRGFRRSSVVVVSE
jgi:hypothetical protein